MTQSPWVCWTTAQGRGAGPQTTPGGQRACVAVRVASTSEPSPGVPRRVTSRVPLGLLPGTRETSVTHQKTLPYLGHGPGLAGLEEVIPNDGTGQPEGEGHWPPPWDPRLLSARALYPTHAQFLHNRHLPARGVASPGAAWGAAVLLVFVVSCNPAAPLPLRVDFMFLTRNLNVTTYNGRDEAGLGLAQAPCCVAMPGAGRARLGTALALEAGNPTQVTRPSLSSVDQSAPQ